MSYNTISTKSSRRPFALAAASVVAVGLVLGATACSSDDDAIPTRVAPTSVARPGTATTNPAREALLRNILDSHHAAGDFVGARTALLERDGTITEATSGTATVDPTSAPVDVDVA